jgi:thiopurine S-methyltransferase
MEALSEQYWKERYQKQETGWDLGEVSPPIKAYFETVENKELNVLIPGCGNGHEGRYLFNEGYMNIYLLDFASEPLDTFYLNTPGFPKENLYNEDFFSHEGRYDIIVEQTLFCAIDPDIRSRYAQHLSKLLKPGGKVIGLLFNRSFVGGPPFGGNKEEYLTYFSPNFSKVKLEDCYNSISPRSGSELFIQLEK